jgi:hypothetical protein
MPASTGVDALIVSTREPTTGAAKERFSISPEDVTGCLTFHNQNNSTVPFSAYRTTGCRSSVRKRRPSEEHSRLLIVFDSIALSRSPITAVLQQTSIAR